MGLRSCHRRSFCLFISLCSITSFSLVPSSGMKFMVASRKKKKRKKKKNYIIVISIHALCVFSYFLNLSQTTSLKVMDKDAFRPLCPHHKGLYLHFQPLGDSLPRQNTQLMLLEIFSSLLFHCKTLPSGPLFHLSGLVILIQLPLIHPALSFTCTFSHPGSAHIL